MSLCRSLPMPSERMGILWNLLSIKDSIVLEYGPAGTTHYSVGVISSMGIELSNKLFSTHMDEDDVIMGDVTRLEESLKELDREYNPKYIFVLGSAISSIIATDIEGVCQSIEDEINAKMVCFEGGGFKGDYSSGIDEVLSKLVNNISEKEYCEEGTFNIIGISPDSYRFKADAKELEEIMEKAFNYKLKTCFVSDCSIEGIREAGNAQINIVFRQEGLKTAEFMKKKFGIPYIYESLYGYSGTIKFLEEVSDTIGKEINRGFMGMLKGKLMVAKQYSMFRRFSGKIPYTSIIGNYDFVVGISKFLSEDVSFEVERLICNHSFKKVGKSRIEFFSEEEDKFAALEEINKSFVIGDDESLRMINESNKKLRLAMPVLNKPIIATHIPVIGYKGADYILENAVEYINGLD